MILTALLLAAATPAHTAFNPVEFFHGRTRGDGILKIIFQPSKRIVVDNEGTAEKDGWLLLKQTIHEPNKPPRIRYWRLKQAAPGRYEGTLTDAASPVRVDVEGSHVRIRYRGKDHLNFDQMLVPIGPREVRNRMRVKRFGIVVAHFDEIIRKVDQPRRTILLSYSDPFVLGIRWKEPLSRATAWPGDDSLTSHQKPLLLGKLVKLKHSFVRARPPRDLD